MSSQVDILCAIDAQTILEKYPNPSTNPAAPTVINNGLIYMTVKKDQALSGNGGGELKVGIHIGDNLRWREQTLSLNFEYSVQFYNFVSSSQNLITLPPTLVGGVQADGTLSEKDTAMPKHVSGAPPWLPTSINDAPYHFWQSTAEAAGEVTYHWQFVIADDAGNVKGYFQWDPFIHIED